MRSSRDSAPVFSPAPPLFCGVRASAIAAGIAAIPLSGMATPPKTATLANMADQPGRKRPARRHGSGTPVFSCRESIGKKWCGWPDLNRQGFRRGILSPLCLPISPHPPDNDAIRNACRHERMYRKRYNVRWSGIVTDRQELTKGFLSFRFRKNTSFGNKTPSRVTSASRGTQR